MGQAKQRGTFEQRRLEAQQDEAKRQTADNPNIERIYLGAREAYSDAARLASNAGAAAPAVNYERMYNHALGLAKAAGFKSVNDAIRAAKK